MKLISSQSLTFVAAVAALFFVCDFASAQGDGKRKEGRNRGRQGQQDRARRGGGMNAIMAALDTNKDGELSEKEIKAAVKSLKALDKNGDGKVDRRELRGSGQRGQGQKGQRGQGQKGQRGKGQRGQGRQMDPKKMVERIMKADKNGDGKISEEEAPQRMKRGFERMDTNGDGFVEKSEVEAMMKRRTSGGKRKGKKKNEDQ